MRKLAEKAPAAVRVCVHPVDQNLVAVCCARGSLLVFNLTMDDTDGQRLQLSDSSIHAAFTPAGDWMLIATAKDLLAYRVPDTSYWDPEASKGTMAPHYSRRSLHRPMAVGRSAAVHTHVHVR